MLYNNLSSYFREKYGKRLSKICIDGGFSCPNRDGALGTHGCIFCGERGSGEHIAPEKSIRRQVEDALRSAKDGEEFVAYFQNFTNTYADVETLRERYDAALIDGRIRVLAIGTRPDCIDEEKARLIASYKERCDVWVELGLQSSDDKTAELINRGYKSEVFERACKILEGFGIPVVVHLIVGLPRETLENVKNTVQFINKLPIWGIKIHSIYVMKNTRLAEMHENGEYTPPTLYGYTEGAAYILSHIRQDLVVHRVTGDCPRDMLIAPEWNKDKNKIIEAINKRLAKEGLKQGSLFEK